ncbi:MAG TPA: SDR family oxidoreductase [Alphaproteobacteria bacterium]|jgi:NAD(P)-dependent dehydrogenase (short-subunit alcohol dehydrogenase family)|nr:SDR family oxidoreductase [Alphaproteobacteria bacterium]
MRGLKGKVAVIAGGATGIGAATATRLAEEGVSVVIGDVNIDTAKALAETIRAGGGTATAVAFDVSDDASVKHLVDTAVETYGGIDCMHANAADLSLCLSDSDAVDLSLDIWDKTMAVNLRGHLLCTRHAIPALLKRGGGAMVYTSSGAAYVGEPERVAYAVSKSGINALMRHVASRWGKEGIRSNAIAPGLIMTDNALANMPKEAQDHILAIGRSARLGRPADIASTVAMLMSDDGDWINGQVISVDGGITMRG